MLLEHFKKQLNLYFNIKIFNKMELKNDENKTKEIPEVKIEQGKKFNVALIQMKVLPDRSRNLKRAEELIITAVNINKAQIIILPEVFNNFVAHGNLEDSDSIEKADSALGLIKRLAKELDVYIIGGSIAVKEIKEGLISNTCFCIDRKGEIKTVFKKIHLFDVNIPGKVYSQESKNITAGSEYGIFETEYGKIGIGICYDLRFPEYALILKKEYDIDMIVYPAAFHEKTGEMHWEVLGRGRALDLNVWVALAGQALDDSKDAVFRCYGHSMIIDPFGKVVNTTGVEEAIVCSEIDLTKNNEISAQIPVWKAKRYNDLYNIVKLKK